MRLNLSDKMILVVEDFAQMRTSLRKMVQHFGAGEVDEATDGEEALRKIHRKRYDLILCDYALGEGKDGQQILEEAKHHNLLKHSAMFMMITAETTSDMVMGAVEYHPDDYLAKPFTREVLGRRLQALIGRKRDFDDIEAALHRRRFDLAIQRCDAHIAGKPANVLEFLRYKSGLCLRLGRPDEAAQVCERVLAMRDVPWAMLDLAKAHHARGRLLKARDMLNALVATNSAYVAAYDWLAKCQASLGDPHAAQASLTRAVELSPRSVPRQRALGTLAYRNGDLAGAEKAFSRAVRLGRHSIYQDSADRARLARVLAERGADRQALKAADELVKSGQTNGSAGMLGHAVRAIVHRTRDRDDDARQSIAASIALYTQAGAKVPTASALELASACLAAGQWREGARVVADIVRNHHDNTDVLERAADIFALAGCREQGQSVIASAREEVVSLGVEGSSLVAQDRLAEAVEFFHNVADRLPDNRLINLNASQVMIMYMERHGRDDKLLYRTRHYLERLQRLDPGNTESQILLTRYESLATTC